MVFSSPAFLFGFLPIVLFAYYLSPHKVRNGALFVSSLLFYAWGEVFYVGIMLVSILSNYTIGLLLDKSVVDGNSTKATKVILAIGVAVNVTLLISFKYANFMADNINALLGWAGFSAIALEPVHLPLGISFFTFQAISYIVDVYRRYVRAQQNILNLALYISLFPQLIAGPIVRYHDVSAQISARSHSIDDFASGVQRFIIGLSKKLLIANPMGEVADNIFALSAQNLTMPLAWIGLCVYSLQIYFDFSGYSDMAIGLGRMFGFRFMENFNCPYISKSLREFWRRWHISLSTWFKDYVFIPLGGSRCKTLRTYANLLLVFLLTGIWHGASWNFVIWGLFHGFFLASEHWGFSRILARAWHPLQHLYFVMVLLLSWVLFRTETLVEAQAYFDAMTSIDRWPGTALQFSQVGSMMSVYIFVLGVIFSLPIYPCFKRTLDHYRERGFSRTVLVIHSLKVTFILLLLVLNVLVVSSTTYHPFIYFRF